MKAAFAALMVLAFATPAQAGGNDAMAKAASNFYTAYSTLHRLDGIPDSQDRAQLTPFISDRLNTLLAASRAAEEKFTNAYKNSPPLIEGDIFTSNYEGATSYKTGACGGGAKAAHCAIALTYDPAARGDSKNKPVHWTDTVFLVNTPTGWKLDDIAFGGEWDFANKGRLSGTLNMVLTTAGGAGNN